MWRLVKALLPMAISISCQDYRGVILDKSSADAEKDTRRFNPSKIVFNVVDDPYIEAMSGSDKTVPKIQVTFDEEIPVNFYQVQRCDYRAEVLDQDKNDPLATNYPTYRTVVAHLFAWGSANVNGCIFLGGSHRQKVFEDITAPSGKYFYLFRPCLSPKRSQFGKRRTCHYLYRKTNEIEYIDTFGQDKWKLRLELAAMRSKLQAHFSQLSNLIINKADFLNMCETNEARKCAFKARIAGVTKVVLTAAASTTAAILSGGTAAFVTGAATIKVADKVFSNASDCSLQCDTSIFDRRIDELQEGLHPIAEAVTVKLAKLNALSSTE